MLDVIKASLSGDSRGRQLLYFRAYLWPRVLREFADELKPLEIDASGARAGALDLAGVLAAVALGPQPEPPDLPAYGADAVAATKWFRERLLNIVDDLEKGRSAQH